MKEESNGCKCNTAISENQKLEQFFDAWGNPSDMLDDLFTSYIGGQLIESRTPNERENMFSFYRDLKALFS